MADRNSHRARWAGTVQSWKESGLTPWRDPTSSRNTDNRTSPNRDPDLGGGSYAHRLPAHPKMRSRLASAYLRDPPERPIALTP